MQADSHTSSRSYRYHNTRFCVSEQEKYQRARGTMLCGGPALVARISAVDSTSTTVAGRTGGNMQRSPFLSSTPTLRRNYQTSHVRPRFTTHNSRLPHTSNATSRNSCLRTTRGRRVTRSASGRNGGHVLVLRNPFLWTPHSTAAS